MITLNFRGLRSVDDASLRAPAGFRISENFMYELPGNTAVCAYRNHHWWVEEKPFARYDCADRLLMRFQSRDKTPTQVFGPFHTMFVADGTVYADEQLFAKHLDETLLWHSFKLETYWPDLLVLPADRQ
jgi:hypothetical protein